MRDIEALDWRRCALVLVDLQRGYCDPTSDAATRLGWDVSAAEEICQKHVAFLDEARQVVSSGHIIWFQMEEAPDTLAKNLHYGPQSKDFVPLCVRGTPGHDFHIVKPRRSEPVFQKFHMSGFSSDEFREYLRVENITQLVYTGVITSRCVNATLITGSALGYESAIIPSLVVAPKQLDSEAAEHLKVSTFFYALPLEPTDFIERMKQTKAAFVKTMA